MLNIVLFMSLALLQAFFDKDYISSHPEEMERINQLKELMQEQVSITYKSHHFPVKRSNLQICFFFFFLFFEVSHSGSWFGCPWEAGPSRNASPSQKAGGSVPYDEEWFVSCQSLFCFLIYCVPCIEIDHAVINVLVCISPTRVLLRLTGSVLQEWESSHQVQKVIE